MLDIGTRVKIKDGVGIYGDYVNNIGYVVESEERLSKVMLSLDGDSLLVFEDQVEVMPFKFKVGDPVIVRDGVPVHPTYYAAGGIVETVPVLANPYYSVRLENRKWSNTAFYEDELEHAPNPLDAILDEIHAQADARCAEAAEIKKELLLMLAESSLPGVHTLVKAITFLENEYEDIDVINP